MASAPGAARRVSGGLGILPEPGLMAQRFTIDGSAELEARLGTICEQSLQGVQAIVPAQKLEALVLAGGYGRGEGGVLRTGTSDEPYNDLEFYLFLRGNRLLNERRYHARLAHLAERLSLQ